MWWPQPSLRAEEPLWIWTEWSYRQPRTTPSPPQHQCDSAQCEPAPVSGVWVEDGDQEAAHHLTMAPQGDTPSSTPRWVPSTGCRRSVAVQGSAGAVQGQCRGRSACRVQVQGAGNLGKCSRSEAAGLRWDTAAATCHTLTLPLDTLVLISTETM